MAKAFRALAFTGIATALTGCVGVVINTPEQSIHRSYPHERYPRASQETPTRVTGTERSWERREWCGIKVVVAVIPIPLQLPLCTSYQETSYDGDAEGSPVILKTTQTMKGQFYGCGPLMMMGPIMHTYRGNIFCGTFGW